MSWIVAVRRVPGLKTRPDALGVPFDVVVTDVDRERAGIGDYVQAGEIAAAIGAERIAHDVRRAVGAVEEDAVANVGFDRVALNVVIGRAAEDVDAVFEVVGDRVGADACAVPEKLLRNTASMPEFMMRFCSIEKLLMSVPTMPNWHP